MLVPQLLLETLEDLRSGDFDKFKWFLGQKILVGCEKIPQCDLESPHRHHTVSKMVETYGEEMAVNMTVAILKKMKHNNAAEELQEKHRDGAAAQEKVSHPPVTSSPASGLPTGQKISANGATRAQLRDDLREAPAPRTPTRGIVMGSPSGNLGDDICSMVQGLLLDMNVGGSVFTGNPGRNVGGDNHGFFTGNPGGNVGGDNHGFFTGNPGGNVGGDNQGFFTGHPDGNVGGDSHGFVTGNPDGNVGGDIHSIITRLLDGDVGRTFGGNVLSGGVSGKLKSNFRGIVKGDVNGNVGSNVCGFIRGNVRGNVGHNFCGVVEGDVYGKVGSNFSGVITGDVRGNIGSNFDGILMGKVCGKVGSNFGRVAEGNMADYIREIVMTSW